MKRTNVTQDEFARLAGTNGELYLIPAGATEPWSVNGAPATRHQVMTLLADYAKSLDRQGHLAPRSCERVEHQLRVRSVSAYALLRLVAYYWGQWAAGKSVEVPRSRAACVCPVCGHAHEPPQG